MVFAEMHRHRLLSRYDSGVLRLAVSCFFVVQYGVSAPLSLSLMLQEGDLVTLLEADRSPAGLPPLPAHQVTTFHRKFC